VSNSVGGNIDNSIENIDINGVYYNDNRNNILKRFKRKIFNKRIPRKHSTPTLQRNKSHRNKNHRNDVNNLVKSKSSNNTPNSKRNRYNNSNNIIAPTQAKTSLVKEPRLSGLNYNESIIYDNNVDFSGFNNSYPNNKYGYNNLISHKRSVYQYNDKPRFHYNDGYNNDYSFNNSIHDFELNSSISSNDDAYIRDNYNDMTWEDKHRKHSHVYTYTGSQSGKLQTTNRGNLTLTFSQSNKLEPITQHKNNNSNQFRKSLSSKRKTQFIYSDNTITNDDITNSNNNNNNIQSNNTVSNQNNTQKINNKKHSNHKRKSPIKRTYNTRDASVIISPRNNKNNPKPKRQASLNDIETKSEDTNTIIELSNTVVEHSDDDNLMSPRSVFNGSTITTNTNNSSQKDKRFVPFHIASPSIRPTNSINNINNNNHNNNNIIIPNNVPKISESSQTTRTSHSTSASSSPVYKYIVDEFH